MGKTKRIGYLVNQYPKVSHTFIRREIQALERDGYEVARFSVRPPPEQVLGETDRAEQYRTEVLLKLGIRGLAQATLRQGLKQPVALAKAAWMAARFGLKSGSGLPRHLAYLGEACVLAERLEEQGISHLHVHFGTNPTTVAALTRVLGGPPFSFTVHGPEEFDRADAIGLAEKVEGAAFVAAISSFGKSQLLRRASIGSWSKIQVIRCGLDHEFLATPPTPVPAIPRLVCVGRLCEQKGQLLLLEAAAQVINRGVRMELVLVGDGEMRPDVEAAIARWGLKEQVTITGWVDELRVREELENARALVLPSFAEGLPVVIMESLARGRPVISTYVAGIPELVEHGVSGWLVPAGNVPQLADAMFQALTLPPEALSRMGCHGRERVLEFHDIERSAHELSQLLDRTEK